MKLHCLVFGICAASLAHAFGDLTILQSVEGIGPITQMTMKIKGDKARIDVSPQIATIFDGKTGDMINLMIDQKMVVRVSADKMKAAVEMMRKSKPQKEGAEKPKLVATGKKETVNGYQTEQYVYQSPDFKATYWIAASYPDGAAILKQLQAIKMDALNGPNSHMPDYRDFPGVPVKTVLSTGGKEMTTTLNSIKQDALSDTEFAVPSDYKEMSMPDIFGGAKAPSPVPTP
jgi:Domain of unknown function (DUF4412)